jgi:phosphatidylglycerol:prolipoprotein diacylglycerol transferase
MNDFYVHNIDPFAIRFPFSIGPIQGIPWYGLMYLIGFIFAFYLLENLRKNSFLKLQNKNDIHEFINYAVYGVIIGGRLGHFIFYQPEVFWTDPLEILMVWHGGMASHGGIIGVFIAMYFFAKKKSVPFINTLDAAAIVTTPGLGFGRIGNFINGEMPGKVTDVSWAVIFPKYDSLARHPSQIYQALGEGLFLFIILWFILPRTSQKAGFHVSMFFVFYGIQRIVTENYREYSDSLSSIIPFLTQGQLLSVFMVLIGIVLCYYTSKTELFKKYQ